MNLDGYFYGAPKDDYISTSAIYQGVTMQSLTSQSTHNRLFRGRVFPANHLAVVLTKQTYNNHDKYKKPKDIHKKPQKLSLTKPN